MTPTRLPRPGQVTELCRLCAAELVLSLDNPRRVCAKCGEINLPSEHAVEAPRVMNAARPPRELRPELVYLGIGAATPVIWAILRATFLVVGLPHAALLPMLSFASIGTGWWIHKRLGGSGFRAAGFWSLGFFGGLGLAYGLVLLGALLFLQLLWH